MIDPRGEGMNNIIDNSNFRKNSETLRSCRNDLGLVEETEWNGYNDIIISTMDAVDFYVVVGRVEIAEGREIAILLMSSNGGFFVVQNNYNDDLSFSRFPVNLKRKEQRHIKQVPRLSKLNNTNKELMISMMGNLSYEVSTCCLSRANRHGVDR